MPPPADRYPGSRPELARAFRRGDAALHRAMTGAVRFYDARQMIIRAGEEHSQIYRLRRGWVFLARTTDEGRRQIVSIGVPGDLVGVAGMLFTRSPETIVCLTRVSVEMIDWDRLLELTVGNADVALRLLYQLGQEQRRLHSWVLGLGRCSAEERIAALLLDVRERLRIKGFLERGVFRLPLTQLEIGDTVGLTDVHVNRILRRLRESGTVVVGRGVAQVRKRDALEGIARALRDLWDNGPPSRGARRP